MIQDVSENCTGCGACYSICPVNAINMIENNEGFLYPTIDENKCVKCGLCMKACPVLNTTYKNTHKPKCFAVMASDEIRYKSASGGVFPVLAYEFLNRGGYVAGAIWDENWGVKHIISNQKDEIEKMRSSKYLQSTIGNCLQETKKILDNGYEVLFTGTPCQIAGLKSYLKKDYEKLYTVEIICHGTPSPKVFRKYLEEELIDEDFITTNFRDKINGWSPRLTISTSTTKRIICNSAKNDTFMNAFLKNLCLRKSCHNCNFNKIPRQADLTTGDFWGVWKFDKKLDDKKGTSILFINNPKGAELFNKVKKDFIITKTVPFKKAIKGNINITKSTPNNPYRNRFFSSISNYSFKESVNLFNTDKCDYLIVNLWDTNNYGACLTAYAMQELVKKYNYIPRLLNTEKATNENNYIDSISKDFADKFLYTTTDLNFKKAKKYTKSIKGVIVGSDQVFRLDYTREFLSKFLLNFVNKNTRKLAISASFGINKEEYLKNKYLTRKIKKYIKKSFDSFDYLSCREVSGKAIYKDVYNLNSDMILDPVFLINKNKFNDIINHSKENYSNKIVNYILDDDDEKLKDILNYLSDKFNTKTISLYNQHNKILVSDWLKAIKDCKFLITDSFHGVCFALIFNKPFICLINKKRGSARFESLIELFKIKDCFVSDLSEVYNKQEFTNIDWERINSILNNEQIRCLKIIDKVLNNNHSNNIKKEYKPIKNFNLKILNHKLKLIKYVILKRFYKKKELYYKNKINNIKQKIEWGI